MEAPILAFLLPSEAGRRVFGNPLQWWKTHEVAFPNLAKLAKVQLAIQATSAPSERVFSQAALIGTAKRNRLDAEMMGKLLFLKVNWDAEEAAGWDMLSCVRAAEEDPDEEMEVVGVQMECVGWRSG